MPRRYLSADGEVLHADFVPVPTRVPKGGFPDPMDAEHAGHYIAYRVGRPTAFKPGTVSNWARRFYIRRQGFAGCYWYSKRNLDAFIARRFAGGHEDA